MPPTLSLKEKFFAKPLAVARQGDDLFAAMPLYRSKRKYTAVYINPDIYARLSGLDTAPPFGEMAAVLEDFFSATIEPENGNGEIIGTAYADRQADPLNLSLSGNLGSGRAYYTGAVFNIKGERTVLATSDKKRFSDGLLEMERCIWEAVIGNALQGAMTNGLNGVLAIFDMNEKCDVLWREQPVKRGKIIRIDEDGALDRITHLFYKGQPLTEQRLRDTASAFGRLEGDKFIERIIHGTWSPGNISPDGHLIDFDTVGAVKGRSPQFSSTRWHHENYFGYEFHGQLKVIEAMAQDSALNAPGIVFADLKEQLLSAMQRQIATRFAGLMGVADQAAIYARYTKEIDALCALWIELARKGFKKHEEMLTKHADNVGIHLFDFSQFFRVYPLLRRSGRFDAQEAVNAMAENNILADPYAVADDSERPEIEREHLDAVYKAVGGDFVGSEMESQLLHIACLSFVKKYDALHRKILEETHADIFAVEVKAYIVNEDRFYLFPAYTASFQMAKNEEAIAPDLQNKLISALVLGNRRDPAVNPAISDFRLYEEGYVFRQFDGRGGHEICFRLFDTTRHAEVKTVEIGQYVLKKTNEYNDLFVYEAPLDNIGLLDHAARDTSLHIEQILLLNS